MLGRKWESATAKIVAKKFKEGGERSGAYEYVADISPTSGAEFRTKLKQPRFMSHVVNLPEGAVLQVMADVRRQKAKFDRTDPQVNGKGTRSDKDVFNEALSQAPGSPTPGDAANRRMGTTSGAGLDDDEESGPDPKEDY